MFTEFKKTLKKQELNRFEKVLKLYPTLRPLYYLQVKEKIKNEHKLSESTRTNMLELNDYIFNSFFETQKYIKKYKEFKIHDEIYVDENDTTEIILEFKEINYDMYVITNKQHYALNLPILIHRINHKPRLNNRNSIYDSVKNNYEKSNLTQVTINSNIEMYLKQVAEQEINFNPEYQRGLVWTISQKQEYIKALLLGNCKLSATFIYNEDIKQKKDIYELLDGKQRLSTVLSFIKNEFNVNGFYYKDLSKVDIYRFLRTPYDYTLIRYYNNNKKYNIPIEQKIELFLQINDYGTKIPDQELNKIKEKYKKSQLI